MKKTLILLAMVFFAFNTEVRAESGFNALDPGDPHYAEYQRGLCDAVWEDYSRLARERFEMDRWSDHGYPILYVRSEDQRQDWISNWVLTTELRDKSLQTFDENCR